uniref:Putative secreted protein n=1 Tax=Ixodes ricinus TaxID=34613 RepID=A0A6B0UNY7_IXORI
MSATRHGVACALVAFLPVLKRAVCQAVTIRNLGPSPGDETWEETIKVPLPCANCHRGYSDGISKSHQRQTVARSAKPRTMSSQRDCAGPKLECLPRAGNIQAGKYKDTHLCVRKDVEKETSP